MVSVQYSTFAGSQLTLFNFTFYTTDDYLPKGNLIAGLLFMQHRTVNMRILLKKGEKMCAVQI